MAYDSITQGVVSSNNMNAANAVPDVEKILYLMKPYQTPLMQYLWFSGRKSKEVTSPFAKFSWFESELYPHQTATKMPIDTTGSPAILSLNSSNCVNIGIFNLDDIVLIEETDQMAFVQSKSNSLVQLGAIDGTSSLSSLEGESVYLKIIGSRNTEYSGVRAAVSVKETEKFNYLNIFSESVATTVRHQAGESYTDGVDHAALVAKKIEEMKLQAERYFLFAPNQGYATSGNYRTTWGHGFLGRIQTNVNSYSPSLTEEIFDDHLRSVFEKGSNRKIHLCGSGQLTEINKFVKERYELNPNPVVSIYGVNVREYLTPFGTVDIIWNPVMDGKFTDYGFTIDAEKIRLRYMANDKKGSRRFRIEEG
ncbi:MAG: hypothetical protein B6D45_06495, partial [Ignavibacteriales bacterium UTCHB3]